MDDHRLLRVRCNTCGVTAESTVELSREDVLRLRRLADHLREITDWGLDLFVLTPGSSRRSLSQPLS
jgi:hypothetical protein